MKRCYEEIYSNYSLYLCGVGLLCLIILGVLGNIFGAMHVTKHYLQNSIYRYFVMALCFADTGTLISSLIIISGPRTLELLKLETSIFAALLTHMTKLVYPLSMMSQAASAWVTAVMSVMRCLSMNESTLRFKTFMLPNVTKRIIIIIMIGSLIYNLPRIWEIEIDECFISTEFRLEKNASYSTRKVIVPTAMRMHPVYIQLYISIMYTIFVFALPFLFITVGNVIIIYQVRKLSSANLNSVGELNFLDNGHQNFNNSEKSLAASRTNTAFNGSPTVELAMNRHFHPRRTSIKGEPNFTMITVLLVVISVTFVACSALPFVTNIIELFYGRSMYMLNHLTDTGNFLICVNCSCNFIFYIIFSGKLRRNLLPDKSVFKDLKHKYKSTEVFLHKLKFSNGESHECKKNSIVHLQAHPRYSPICIETKEQPRTQPNSKTTDNIQVHNNGEYANFDDYSSSHYFLHGILRADYV